GAAGAAGAAAAAGAVAVPMRERVRELTAALRNMCKCGILSMFMLGLLPTYVGMLADCATAETFGSTPLKRLRAFGDADGAGLVTRYLAGAAFYLVLQEVAMELRKMLRPQLRQLRRLLPRPRPALDMPALVAAVEAQPLLPQLLRMAALVTIVLPVCAVLLLLVPLRVGCLVPHWGPLRVRHEDSFEELQLPLQLLLFHVVLPTVIERCNAQAVVRRALRAWFLNVSQQLGLRAFLFRPDLPGGVENPAIRAVVAAGVVRLVQEGVGAIHGVNAAIREAQDAALAAAALRNPAALAGANPLPPQQQQQPPPAAFLIRVGAGGGQPAAVAAAAADPA
ncbi:unnamed protein product, partial [Phaeothamnion confervicola]